MSETYVCAECTAAVERGYNVKYIIRTCDECGTNGRFVNDALLDHLAELSEDDLPDDWSEMSISDRLRHAIKQGLINPRDVVA